MRDKELKKQCLFFIKEVQLALQDKEVINILELNDYLDFVDTNNKYLYEVVKCSYFFISIKKEFIAKYGLNAFKEVKNELLRKEAELKVHIENLYKASKTFRHLYDLGYPSNNERHLIKKAINYEIKLLRELKICIFVSNKTKNQYKKKLLELNKTYKLNKSMSVRQYIDNL